MTDKQKLILQKSLTRSAKKAQPYWVRGLIGHTETDQGFFPIESIPITNPYQEKITSLAEFIEDSYLNFDKSNKHLLTVENNLTNLSEAHNEFVGIATEEIKKLKEDVVDLQIQIKDMATFNLG